MTPEHAAAKAHDERIRAEERARILKSEMVSPEFLEEVRAEEREQAIGTVEYSINDKALREKVVARIREGNEQHLNRARGKE